MFNRYSMIALLLCAAACDPDDRGGIQGVDGLGGESDAASEDAAADAGETANGDGGAPDDALGLDAEPLAYAVVASDYTVASITLLEPDGAILARDFIHSGSASAGLVTALSGDVVLPTRSGDPGILTILDRFRTDVLTRIDPANGRVLGQLKTSAPNGGEDDAAYSSNPQDYVLFGEHDAWVTRFEPNTSVGEDHADRGLDLLHVDPTDLERDDRISLWHLNGEAERANPDTGETGRVTVYARPSAMVRLGDRLVVGIASLSLAFDAAGAGMVALVDPEARTAEGFELPGLQNCGSVVPVPDEATRVVVACSGFFGGDLRGGAGLALLALQDGALAIEHVWRTGEHADAPLAVGGVVALGGSEVAAVAAGELAMTDAKGNELTPDTNDVMYVLDLATGSATRLFESAGRYTIGSGDFNPRRGLLLVPDAATDADGKPTAGVRIFERRAGGGFEPRDVIETHDILPARQVRAM